MASGCAVRKVIFAPRSLAVTLTLLLLLLLLSCALQMASMTPHMHPPVPAARHAALYANVNMPRVSHEVACM